MLPARGLARALRAIEGHPFEGVLCRAVRADVLYGFRKGSRYQPRPLHSLGAPARGARFTPRGGAPALYIAVDQATALREYFQIGPSEQLRPVAGAGALVLFNIEARLGSVLDLTQPDVQGALHTDGQELASPWRPWSKPGLPPTQRLGAAVVQSGRFDAIRYGSTRGPGDCLAIFTGLLAAPAYVRIRDESNRLVEELP